MKCLICSETISQGKYFCAKCMSKPMHQRLKYLKPVLDNGLNKTKELNEIDIISTNTSLPSIRISKITNDNIRKALELYNKDNLVVLSLSQFRRLSYELLSQLILQGHDIPFKIE